MIILFNSIRVRNTITSRFHGKHQIKQYSTQGFLYSVFKKFIFHTLDIFKRLFNYSIRFIKSRRVKLVTNTAPAVHMHTTYEQYKWCMNNEVK